jgi:FKBP-type peptidyl-prolyl cis-trans isomerase 2/predicted TPR repeat methyltransferase
MTDILTEKEPGSVKAKFGDAVKVHFTCKLEDGTVHDSSVGTIPVEFTIGEGQFMPAFEKAVIGIIPGTSKTVKIPSELAYGPRQDEKVVTISRAEFPKDITPEPKLQFQFKKDDGETSYVTVIEVDESKITLDGNHPLAGKDLFFDIELLEITKPGPSAIACFQLGSILLDNNQLDHLDETISWYAKAIQIEPRFTEAYYNLGVALQLSNRLDDAISAYQAVIKLKPDHRDAYHNLGNAYKDTGKPDSAMECYQKALELDPAYANAHNSMGTLLQEKGEIDKAIESYKKAIEYKTDFYEAYFNIGTALQEKGRIDEAIKYYQDSLRIKSDFAEAHVRLSSALLLSENFEEGWQEYEWRRKLRNQSLYGFSQPLWDGSDISGRTILVYSEQGFGNTIQFIRYVPLIAGKGAKVIAECQKELKPLLDRMEGLEYVITQGDGLPEFDVHCPLLSLPMIFGTDLQSIPAKVPYISADPEISKKWEEKIQAQAPGIKIGLAWSGNPKFKKDRMRSCELRTFSPLAKIKGITYFSLQKDEAAEQAKSLPKGMKIVDFSDDIKDFGDTAGIIDNLDLVISVDTSVSHLAGALGKPVWTLIPFSPEWPWMLEREDSPWYPTMKLFRQPSAGDWQSVIKRVKKELEILINGPH